MSTTEASDNVINDGSTDKSLVVELCLSTHALMAANLNFFSAGLAHAEGADYEIARRRLIEVAAELWGLPALPPDVINSFWQKVEIGNPSQCWPWKAGLMRGNYGSFFAHGKTWVAHVLAYRLSKGYIPVGYVVRHNCDHRPCCNPNHLIVGTQKDNVHDMIERGRAKLINTAKLEYKRRNKLSEHQINEIRRLYGLEGNTLEKLAAAYGVHFSTIARLVKGRKPRGAKRKLTMEQAEEIRRLHKEEGIKPKALSKLYNVSESSIGLILKNKQYLN